MVQEILRCQLRWSRLRRFRCPRRATDGLGGWKWRTDWWRWGAQNEHKRREEAGRCTFHFLCDASTTTYVFDSSHNLLILCTIRHLLSLAFHLYKENGSQFNAFCHFRELTSKNSCREKLPNRFFPPLTVSKPSPKAAPAPAAPNRSLNASKPASNNVSNQQIEELSSQLMDMRLNLEGLEKERDFYFSKLRDIEILCQEADESDNSAIIAKILDILYATEVSYDGDNFSIV